MTQTADQAQDLLIILGDAGIITSETETPDTLTIAIDHTATSSGITINGSGELLASVDGSTMGINLSGQLYVIGGAAQSLNDLTDVSTFGVQDNDVLAYIGGTWQDATLTISGTTSQSSDDSDTVVSNIPPRSAMSDDVVAVHGHNHNVVTRWLAGGGHYHQVDDLFGTPWTTGPPLRPGGGSGDQTVISTVGNVIGSGQSVVLDVDGLSTTSVANNTHTHTSGTLKVSLA